MVKPIAATPIALLIAAVLVAALGAAAPHATAQSLCDSPAETCGALIAPECLTRLGAGALPDPSLGDNCGAQIERYRECLASVAAICGAQSDAAREAEQAVEQTPAIAEPAPSGGAPEMLAVWAEIKDSDDPEVLETFAANFPNTSLAALARNRAGALREAESAAAREAEAAAIWDEIGAAGDPEALDVFADLYADTTYGPQARARAAALRARADETPDREIEPTRIEEPQPDPAELARQAEERETNRAAQRELNRLGFDVGRPDGVWGPRSEEGLRAFQRAQGAAITGDLTPTALAALRAAPTPAPEAAPEAPTADPAPAVDAAPPTYRAELDWLVTLSGWDTAEGSCTLKLQAVSATEFGADRQRCGSAFVRYALTIAPDGGAITGQIEILDATSGTGRVNITGNGDTFRGRRGRATISGALFRQ